MTTAKMFFYELMKEIPGVKPGKMFGASCMKTFNGKAAAMFWKDELVVKLQGHLLKEALSLDGSKQFEPMEGRPMKEWIQIPFTYKNKWKAFAMASADYVKNITDRKK